MPKLQPGTRPSGRTVMKNLIEHLEGHLGQIDGGWKDSDGTHWPFHVVRFLGGPIANAVTYSTLGLSDTPLQSPVSAKQVRHELLFMARPAFCDRNIPAILHQVGTEAVSRSRPYLRGDVIGPRGTLIPGTGMEALYVSPPVYLPDAFASYKSPEGVSCVFAWLVPITSDEAGFVRTKGWEAFEDRLVSLDPDLLDLSRRSIV
jgi:hypothetical protein